MAKAPRSTVAADAAMPPATPEHAPAGASAPAGSETEAADMAAVLSAAGIRVLSQRLAADAVTVVSVDGRKYRVCRTTGAVTDTATGAEVA